MPFLRPYHRGSHLQVSETPGAAQNPRLNQNCQEARTPRAWPGSTGRGEGRGKQDGAEQGKPGTAGGETFERRGTDSFSPAQPLPEGKELWRFNIPSIIV